MDRCKDCKFFVPHPHSVVDPDLKGECHRYPPEYVYNGNSTAKFPQVDPYAVPCGEYKKE